MLNILENILQNFRNIFRLFFVVISILQWIEHHFKLILLRKSKLYSEISIEGESESREYFKCLWLTVEEAAAAANRPYVFCWFSVPLLLFSSCIWTWLIFFAQRSSPSYDGKTTPYGSLLPLHHHHHACVWETIYALIH